MDSISSSASIFAPKFRCFDPPTSKPPTANHRHCSRPNGTMDPAGGVASPPVADRKIVNGDDGYVLEDVPHLSDYIPDLLVTASRSDSLNCTVTQ